jgi:hypothetical protein
MARSVRRSPAIDGGNGWQSDLPASQLTLNFEPSLPELHASLRAFVAFRITSKKVHAATLAGQMDLSPSTLSRKLNQNDGDANRFNVDDLEAYLAAHPEEVIPVCEYLAAKFSPGAEERQRSRALATVAELGPELLKALATLRGEG